MTILEEVGEPLVDADRFMDFDTWAEWATRVASVAEKRGAWFLLASAPNGDEYVIDLVEPRHVPPASMVAAKLKRYNLRRVRFFRMAGQ